MNEVETKSSVGDPARNVDPARPVKFSADKYTSRVSTICNVGGAFVLTRSKTVDGVPKRLRELQLEPPKPFARNFVLSGSKYVVAYGLDHAMIRALQDDEAFLTAALSLLKEGASLALGDGRIEFTRGGATPREMRGVFSAHMLTIAGRLECVMGKTLNAEASLSRIRRPGLAICMTAIACLPIALFAMSSSLEPFSRLPAIAIGTLLLWASWSRFVRAALKPHALGGALLTETRLLGIVVAPLISFSICVFVNDCLSETMRSPQTFQVAGTLQNVKPPACSLKVTSSSPLLFGNRDLALLPMPCALTKNTPRDASRRYLVQINPGLLGTAFVQSFKIDREGEGAVSR